MKFASLLKISVILMSLILIILTLFGIILLSKHTFGEKYTPEQIHLAIGDDSSEMVVIWSTRDDPQVSVVKYGYDCKASKRAFGYRKALDSEGRIQYIHYVTLKYLSPNTLYCYYVGSHYKWSKNYEFVTFPKSTQWSPSLALFGDMGVENGRAIPSLTDNAIKGNFDAIIDVGDIAYTLNAFNGRMGDAFMRAIEPFASRVPFMVVPGNHEYLCYGIRCPSDYGMSYETRFKMPNSDDNSHYSFTLGPVLFIGISTEVYFQSEVRDLDASRNQMLWLEHVLREANKAENRVRRPWIVVYGHRPLYCSAKSDCYDGMTVHIKEGYDVTGSLLDIDDVLYEYGVDVAFWGHEHHYERMYPVYNQSVYMNALHEDPYINPRATVHFISGTGGMHSKLETFDPMPSLWTAFRSIVYGYTRMTFKNDTHLFVEQIDSENNDRVVDSVWITQEKHSSFKKKNKHLNPIRQQK